MNDDFVAGALVFAMIVADLLVRDFFATETRR